MATWSETALGRRRNNEIPGTWRFPFRPLALLLLLALPAAAAETGPAALDRALALYRQGKVQEALAAYRALLASPDPAIAAEARHNACALENDLGDFKAALPDCREALRLRRAGADPE